jgi:hypothetical protein
VTSADQGNGEWIGHGDAFVRVVDKRSFSHAAKQLHMGQAAIATDDLRKVDDQGCPKAMACCQASTTILAPTKVDWLPAEWHEIAYSNKLKTLVGLRPKPELHPPTIPACRTFAVFVDAVIVWRDTFVFG